MCSLYIHLIYETYTTKIQRQTYINTFESLKINYRKVKRKNTCAGYEWVKESVTVADMVKEK